LQPCRFQHLEHARRRVSARRARGRMPRASSLLFGALIVSYSRCSLIERADDAGLLAMLLEAARDGNSRQLRNILTSRPEVATRIVNQGDGQEGYSALHWAAYGGHMAALQLLLIHGPDLEIRTSTLGSA
jgi:hypothetical protein